MMNLKKKLFAATLLCAGLSMTGVASAADKAPAALIISQAGLGDQSYNDLANAGFQKAVAEAGIKGRPVESKDVVAQATDILRRASEASFGLIVDLEYAHGQPMLDVAKDYLKTKYVILNQVRQAPNIASVLFQEQEGSYLAGHLAALASADSSIKGMSGQPVIGVIGGTKSAGIDKFIAGYIQGAKAANPAARVKVAYANTFSDPTVGYQMAKAMFQEGANVVFQVAGGTGIGVIKAAKEAGKYAIGVDTDQDGVAPGAVLTSMIKRTDVAVASLVKQYAADAFPGGKTVTLGLKENGVGLSEMKHTRSLIPGAILGRVEAARQDILSGKLKVWNVVEQGTPDFMK